MIEAQHVGFAYPGCPDVLRDVTVSLERGGRLAVVGENGSGKTTLARLLCGLVEPTAGTVRVDGRDTCDPAAIYEIRRRVGLVFQDPEDQIVETTVEREVAFGPRNLGLSLDEVDRRVREALATFGINGLAKRPCHLLSAGEKQLVAVASVFVMQPEYIILDESTSLLDGRSRRALAAAIERLLHETGAGLIFISMRLEDIWTCDSVVFLRDGLVDFRGSRADFLRHLVALGMPLGGLGLLATKLEEAVPGFLQALDRRPLSSESLAGVLEQLARRGSGTGGLGDRSAGAEGGAVCP
ncbi:MAG TPA: energy-coupling factor ABC transporter ATP-binding protein [bacterium]|nr:energy-coupling factor ABC transporter ATP-binding protein [bacterium]